MPYYVDAQVARHQQFSGGNSMQAALEFVYHHTVDIARLEIFVAEKVLS